MVVDELVEELPRLALVLFALRRTAQLPRRVCVDLLKHASHVIVQHIISVIEFRPQADRCLVEVGEGVDVHVADLVVVEPGDDVFQIFARQEVRVLFLRPLVHLAQAAPCRLIFVAPMQLIRRADGVDVDVAEHVVPSLFQRLRRAVAVLAQPLQLFECLLLHLAQLAVFPPPACCLGAAFPCFCLADQIALASCTFSLFVFGLLFRFFCRFPFFPLRPLRLLSLVELLPLLRELYARAVAELDLKVGLFREGLQHVVHFLLKLPV